MPHWVLAVNYFFHLAATVLWIGGLAIMALVVWPSSRRVLGSDPRLADLLIALRRRFQPLANLSLAVLVVTGMIQMTADPHYDGLLVFANDWSRAILLKHLVVIGMVIVGAALQWGVAPAQERLALRRALDPDTPDADRLARRERLLSALNLLLGLLALAFTALATAV